MDAKRAAEVLRSRRARPCGNDIHYPGNADYEKGQSCGGDCHGGIVVDEASVLGAQALEAWAWVEQMEAPPERLGDGWICSHYSPTRGYIAGTGMTPLLAVLDAMEKENG